MLKRIFGSIIPGIDRLIEKIPPHIRDIIQKASLAFAALIALLVVIAGINKGLRDAKPKGFQAIQSNRDIFYLQEMREEYAKKRKLVEDVEVDPLEFPSRQAPKEDTKFVPMGRDTINHLMGEKDDLLKHDDSLRPREKSPGYLGDSLPIPQRTPDKKTIEEDEHLKLPKAQVNPAGANLPKDSTASAKPKERDIFDEPNLPQAPKTKEPIKAPQKPAKEKMDFIE